jgi:hypothetical protein
MDGIGTITLDIVFQQFSMELINDKCDDPNKHKMLKGGATTTSTTTQNRVAFQK